MLLTGILLLSWMGALILLYNFEIHGGMQVFNLILYTIIVPMLSIFLFCRYAILSYNPRLVRSVLPAISILDVVDPLIAFPCTLYGLFGTETAWWLGLLLGGFFAFVLFLAVHKFRLFFKSYCINTGLEQAETVAAVASLESSEILPAPPDAM